MLFEQHPTLQAHIQWMANNATGMSVMRWSGFLASLNGALATARRAGFDACKEQAAEVAFSVSRRTAHAIRALEPKP